MIEREKISVVAITKHGAEIAQKLGQALPGAALFISAKFKKEVPGRVTFFEVPIKDLAAQIFNIFDALVYVVSLGAVVRTIAPYLKDKHTDPAVVVIDDKAQFVISVLSGHVGGANELTEELAQILGAQAVITTASDVGQTIPVDILGREFGWTIEFEENITRVSAAVVNQEKIGLLQEAGERNWWKRKTPLPSNIVICQSWEELLKGNFSAYLVITDRVLPAEVETIRSKIVVYRPKSLVIGAGCDRGVSLEEIEGLFLKTFQESGFSKECVRNLATIVLKRDEPGLNEFAQKYGWEIVCYTKDELNTIEHLPNPSAKVLKYTGTPGVCEPAAMLSAGIRELVVEKVKIPKVTMAVARVPFSEEKVGVGV